MYFKFDFPVHLSCMYLYICSIHICLSREMYCNYPTVF